MRPIALGLCLAGAALVSPAIAEPSREDRATATALFDEGRKLAADKKYAEACPKFEAAMRLDPGMGTLFNLSDCYEQLGRTASAWSGFREVAAQAKAAGQAPREQAARERVSALEGKLAKLRIMVSPDLANIPLTITRDGSDVPAALIGTPVPLDPGVHKIRVTAEGKEPFETTVTLSKEGGTVDVQIPALAPKQGGTSPVGTQTVSSTPTNTVAPTATTSPSTSPTDTPVDGSPRPWQKPLGIVAAVVGVVGVGAGVGLGFAAKSKFDESNQEHCFAESNRCDGTGLQMRSDALMLGNVGTVATIAGGVIGAAGIVLWLTAPSAPKQGATIKPQSHIRVGVNGTGLTLQGRF
ncbi:MAG: hypothetical protein IPK82_07130 [Polyangiaceae bacterium]|nr:hypothetical protein [Polyangiaceae bacterium]